MHKYYLNENSKKVSAADIKSHLFGSAACVQIDIRGEVTSTNDIVKALVRGTGEQKGVDEGYVVIADSQTKGRGTNGHSFYSPQDSGIYMSIVLRPDIAAADSVHLTPLCAVAVARAIEQVCGVSCKIKWINDIFVNGKKVCGILTEGAVAGGGMLDYAVVGIGINVSTEIFPDGLDNIAASLLGASGGDTAEIKNKIIADVINNLFSLLPDIKNRKYLDEYRRRLILAGKRVKVRLEGEAKNGVAVDIDNNACLCVKLDDGGDIVLSSSAQLLSYEL